MTGMAAVDLGLRSAAVALLVLFALLMLRTFRRTAAGPLGVLYAYGVASYLICPPIGRALDWSPVTLLCFVGAIGAAVFFWLFARALFDDGFRPRPVHGIVAAAVIAVGLIRRAYPDLPGELFGAGPDSLAAAFYTSASQVISLGFVFLTLAQTALGRRADLVAARRRIRELFVALSGGYIAVIVVVEIFLAGREAPPWLDLLNVATILVVVLAAMLYLVRLRTDLFPQAVAAPAGAPDPADQGQLDALSKAMEEEHLYRREGLTIGGLAAALGLPEHHLRRLINRRLGHRNFNQFLNGHRVAEARARLADPAEARLPVLTIAMDLGYRSLGPFNKAFKEITGRTPSEFRKAALQDGAGDEKPS